jgi:hypothetical protein
LRQGRERRPIRGESAQDGEITVDPVVTCATLVPTPDCPRAGRRSRDGRKVPSATVVRGKTRQCADRVRRVKTGQFDRRPGSRAKTGRCSDRRTARSGRPRVSPRAERTGLRARPAQPVRAVPRDDSVSAGKRAVCQRHSKSRPLWRREVGQRSGFQSVESQGMGRPSWRHRSMAAVGRARPWAAAHRSS